MCLSETFGYIWSKVVSLTSIGISVNLSDKEDDDCIAWSSRSDCYENANASKSIIEGLCWIACILERE